MQSNSVRYAVVGLGHIARTAVLPAFEKPEIGRSKLAAIVSGDRGKLEEVGARFHVEHRATYDAFDALCTSKTIDAVYLALPNEQHRDFTERAARAGIHVLCEKPLALSVEDCRAMVDATAKNRVKLMTAYRLHFEPATERALSLIREGRIGEVRTFVSQFSFQVGAPNLRLERAHGGGTLWDIGVYCINAARHVFAAEPIDAHALAFNNGEPRFREVDEMTSAVLRFPGERSAIFTTGFGTTASMFWRAIGTTGWLHMEPAFGYRGGLRFHMFADGKVENFDLGATDQFAAQIAHFSECVLSDRHPGPDGAEGMKDVAIVEALLKATTSRV